MRFNKLDLNQLVVLDALLDAGSVKGAADRLFLSPPATSCALGRLRDYFKDDLLIQVGKKMLLTPKAESLRKPVRDVLLQVQTITTSSPTFDPLTSTRLVTIEASDYVMLVLLADVMRQAAVEAPLMQFDLRLKTAKPYATLESGQADLVIAPNGLCSTAHPFEPLFEDDWSCLVWRDNALVGSTLTMDQYLALGHVGGTWAGRFVTVDTASAHRRGLARRREVSTPQFTIGPHMLPGTQRVVTLPTRLARYHACCLPLRVVNCPMEVPPLLEMVQWNKYQESDLTIMWVRDLMRRVARAMPPLASKTAAQSPAEPSATLPIESISLGYLDITR